MASEKRAVGASRATAKGVPVAALGLEVAPAGVEFLS